jgi:hypothetical protein
MIVELTKRASAQGLSLTFSYQDGKFSCECLDDQDKLWYSYESSDSIDVLMTISDFVSDPIAFTRRAIASIDERELILVGEV